MKNHGIYDRVAGNKELQDHLGLLKEEERKQMEEFLRIVTTRAESIVNQTASLIGNNSFTQEEIERALRDVKPKSE